MFPTAQDQFRVLLVQRLVLVSNTSYGRRTGTSGYPCNFRTFFPPLFQVEPLDVVQMPFQTKCAYLKGPSTYDL